MSDVRIVPGERQGDGLPDPAPEPGESAELLRELTEFFDAVFWVTEPGERPFRFVSAAFDRIWGRPRAELFRNPHLWTQSIHPDDRDRVCRAVAENEEKGDFEQDYRIVRPDGSIRWIHDRAHPIRDARGKVRRIFGFAVDITDQRGLEHQLLHAQKLEAVGRLAASVSHDFNNLLTVILGFTGIVIDHLPAGDPDRAMLEDVLSAGERGVQLVRQLLSFSRKRTVSPSSWTPAQP